MLDMQPKGCIKYQPMNDPVFKALADATRRQLLDRLFTQDGQALGDLCEEMENSRQAITKHLGVLENAGLVVVSWQGRKKHHYLNPVPVQVIAERWIHKFQNRQLATIIALKGALEQEHNL